MKALQDKAIAETKLKIEVVKKEYSSKIAKLEKKIKELQHQLKLENNRMNRKIVKIKEEDVKVFNDLILCNNY